ALLPTDRLAKLKLVGFAVNCPTGVVEPVPVRETVVVGFIGSLLVKVMLPGTAPAAVGVNVTVTGTDWPELIALGVAIPVIANSAPFNVIIETVKSAAPLFAITRLEVPFEPTDTVPKSRDVGVTDICGWAELVIVPLRFATAGIVPDSPCIVRVPVTFPDAVPVNQTEKVVL